MKKVKALALSALLVVSSLAAAPAMAGGWQLLSCDAVGSGYGAHYIGTYRNSSGHVIQQRFQSYCPMSI